MKSSYFVIAWTVIFIMLGLLNHSKINEFSYDYIDKVNLIEENIKEEKWQQASYILKDTKTDLEEEKKFWYKLINHAYFNEILTSLDILKQSIYLEDKMASLEEVEKVKNVFENLIEDECFDLNRIF